MSIDKEKQASSSQEISEIQRSFPIPQNLQNARSNMILLKGMETYLGNNPEEYIFIDEQHYLSPEKRPRTQEEIDTILDHVTHEIVYQGYSEQAVKDIAFYLAWSEEDYNAFLQKEGTKPFTSRVEVSKDYEAKKQQLAMICRYLVYRYEYVQNLPEDTVFYEVNETGEKKEISLAEKKREITALLQNFYRLTLYDLFSEKFHHNQDRINLIDSDQRKEGIITVTEEAKTLMRSKAQEVLHATKIQESETVTDDEIEALYQKVLAATEGGNIATARHFLASYKGEPIVRDVLKAIVIDRETNVDILSERLQIVWEAEQYRRECGISLDLYYHLNRFPPLDVIPSRLVGFLENPVFNQQILEQIQTNYPELMAKLQKNGSITVWDYYDAMFAKEEESDTPKSKEELRTKFNQAKQDVDAIVPAFLTRLPAQLLVEPLVGLGTRVERSGIVTYYDTNWLPYQIQKHDPIAGAAFIDTRRILASVRKSYAHEIAHFAMQRIGYIVEGLKEKPGHENRELIEELTDFIEGQIELIINKPEEEKSEPDKLPIGRGIHYRHWVIGSLMQLSVRQNMDELYNQGRRGVLEEKDLNLLRESEQNELQRLYKAGLPIERPDEGMTYFLNPVKPDDWIIYARGILRGTIPQLIVDPEERAKRQKTQRFKDAMETRFGIRSLNQRDAVIVLFRYMLELASFSNTDEVEKYLQEHVINADQEDINRQLKELYEAGIKDEDLIPASH